MAIDGWFPIQTSIFLMVISPIVASCPGIDDYFIKGPMLGQGGFGTVCQVRIFHGISPISHWIRLLANGACWSFRRTLCVFAQLSTRCIRTMWLGEDFPWHGLSDFRVSARPPPRSGPSKHSPLSKRGRDTPWNAWSCPCAMPRLKWSRRVTGYWAWRGHQRGCSQQTHNKGFETWCLQNWYSLNMWIFWYFEHRGTQFLGVVFWASKLFWDSLAVKKGSLQSPTCVIQVVLKVDS